MKRIIALTTLVILSITAMNAENVLLKEFRTTNGMVPFDRITTADYEPAIMQGIKEHDDDVDVIVNNCDRSGLCRQNVEPCA